MEIKSNSVKSYSFFINDNSYFLVNQWLNKEGINIEFQSNNNNYIISISDSMYDDILNFDNSEKFIIDYDQKYEGKVLQHHRLIILKSDKVTLRIQNLYGEQVIEFSTFDHWFAFVEILNKFK